MSGVALLIRDGRSGLTMSWKNPTNTAPSAGPMMLAGPPTTTATNR